MEAGNELGHKRLAYDLGYVSCDRCRDSNTYARLQGRGWSKTSTLHYPDANPDANEHERADGNSSTRSDGVGAVASVKP